MNLFIIHTPCLANPKYFGEGVIMGAKGSGADASVQVNFKRAGSKGLALEYAKLTAAG
ncbi:MAG: hypothetical protein Q8L69_09590 [Gallionellaceae bacterium]|nr:hypothetical protein [Gallionellaceae bacterium]